MGCNTNDPYLFGTVDGVAGNQITFGFEDLFGPPGPDQLAYMVCTCAIGYCAVYPPPVQVGAGGPTVQIQNADITEDNITIVLAADPAATGNLSVTVTGASGQPPTDNILTPANPYGPGTYQFSFFSSGTIPTGEYTSVTANWIVNGTSYSNTYPYHFKVMGTYVQTQYNTPAESNCSGTPTAVAVYNSQCTLTSGSMVSGFVAEVANPGYGTGSGHSISYGDVLQEFFCTHPPPYTSFRGNATITGTLGTLSNSTVAVCQKSELYRTGVRVLIQGQGVKTVTDRCPACCTDQGYAHLDNYNTSTACSGIGSLPNALTIRLY